MLGGVFLVKLSLALGTLGLRLPVAADFVIEQMIGGEVGPLGVGIFLHDLAHDLFFHLGAHIGVLFFGGG